MNDWKQMLHMLWTGEGLQQQLAILPGDLPALLALWLPRLFKGGLVFLLILIIYRLVAVRSPRRGRYVRGSRLSHHRFVWLRRFFWLNNYKLRIGGVGYRRKLEPQHLLLSGSPGLGKSQTLHGTLDALRGRRDAVLMTDIGGDALSRFAMNGDLLLNPLDARSVSWSPFAEMEGPADAERLAKSMIPDRESGSSEHEWFLYSQALIAAVLRRLYEQGEPTNESLIHALTLSPPADLKVLVHGLPAQALFHPGAEKMLASVRGIVGSHLAPYSYLQKNAGAKSWSIRRHVREGKAWLWLPYQEDQAAALRPLLATQSDKQSEKKDCWNASLGIGGSAAIATMGGGGGISPGISYGGNLLDTRLFLQAQAYGLFGLGAYAGVGFTGQVGMGDISRGLTTSTGIHAELNIGPLSASGDWSPGGGSSMGGFHEKLPGGRAGVGIGGFAGIGPTSLSTYGSPSLRDLWNELVEKLQPLIDLQKSQAAKCSK